MIVAPHTLISGASSDIGRAIAIRLAKSRPLVLHGRDRERLDETLKALPENAHHQVWSYDLEDGAKLPAALQELLTTLPNGIGGFIHCAGVCPVLPLRSLTPDIVKKAMQINFTSGVQLLRELAKKRLNPAPLTAVVFISSIAADRGAPGYSAYAATKGAINAFVRSMAVELAPRVRINAVAPGAVHTHGTNHILENEVSAAKLEALHPLGIGEPDDVAGLVEFLMGEDSSWITGQIMAADGGRTAI